VGHLQVVTGLSDQLYRNAWGVLGEFWGRGTGRDLVIPVGTTVPVPHWYNEILNRPPPQERSTHSCITDPKVQSQPEDGPHIGPKHVVVVILL